MATIQLFLNGRVLHNAGFLFFFWGGGVFALRVNITLYLLSVVIYPGSYLCDKGFSPWRRVDGRFSAASRKQRINSEKRKI